MKITIPTNRNWVVSFFGDLFANIVDAFNVDLHYSQGKIRTGQYLYPHTVTDDVSGIHTATSFVLTNADNNSGIFKYWAACEKLYKQAASGATSIFTAIFAADAVSGTPTGLIDSDLVKWGVTASGTLVTTNNGIDILVCSTDTDLSILNYFLKAAFAWVNNWWTSDLTDTFSATTTGTPVQITVANTANYNTGDIIEISGTNGFIGTDSLQHSLDGLYTITVVDGTHINLNGGNAYGEILTGNITRTYNTSTKIYYLGQTALVSGVPHILMPFGSSPELFISDDYQIHSIGSPGTGANPTDSSDVEYGRIVFKPGYTATWMVATSLKIYIGLKDKRGDTYPSLVEEYDPFNEQVRETIVQNGSTIGFINGNVLNIIDIKGNFKSYNGNDFDVYAQLPTTEMDGVTISLPHRNGIFVTENRINILLPSASIYYPGGWWTYEIDTKRFYHQGALVPIKASQTSFGSALHDIFGAFFPTQNAGQYLVGASTNKAVGTSQTGIFSSGFELGTFYNAIGRITLGKIPSSEIDSVFRNVLLKYNAVLDRAGLQSGTIVLKYKVADYPENGYGLWGTWINATSFTAIIGLTRIVVGAEMIVTEGQAAGASFHVVGINGTTVTITNENIGFVPSGDFFFNMDNFIRLYQNNGGDITDNTQNYGVVDLPDLAINEWVQLKIEIRGLFSLNEVQVGSQQNLTLEPSDTSAAGSYYAPRYGEKGQL